MAEHVLAPDHANQLVDYLRFLKRKREACISEVAAEFKELRESRLFEDQYTREDVEALVNGLLAVVRTTMKKDLQGSGASSVLLLKQVFEQAEKSGLSLSTDLLSTEDLNLVEGVRAWEESVQSSGAAPQLRVQARTGVLASRGPATLPGIGAGMVQDPRLLDELESQKAANQELTDKFQKLQVQCTTILREKTEAAAQLDSARSQLMSYQQTNSTLDPAYLQGEIARLESELAAARAVPMEPVLLPGQAAGVDSLMAELHSAQARIEQLTNDVDDARAELQAKLEKTKQFLSMRTLLTKKNVVIKQLRDQLGVRSAIVTSECAWGGGNPQCQARRGKQSLVALVLTPAAVAIFARRPTASRLPTTSARQTEATARCLRRRDFVRLSCGLCAGRVADDRPTRVFGWW